MAIYVPPTYRYTAAFNGVAAANNFLTIANPSASAIKVCFDRIHVRSNAAGEATGQPPMIISLASSISGGSLVTNSTGVARLRSAFPTAQAQIRTTNPTATAGAPVYTIRSVESSGAGTGPGVEFDGLHPFFCLEPGEGIVFRTASGDTDQRWVIGIMWQERGAL